MLEGRYQQGFSSERLTQGHDPKIRQDDNGYFLMSISENSKVYFKDFYLFLEITYQKATDERLRLIDKLDKLPADYSETQSYIRAKLVVVDVVLKNIRRFYTDGSNLGVVMTPWCFGTVLLEKIEVYRDRISRGEVDDQNIPEYPYYVINYIDEIYKITLLELFDFPEQAFQMRWQYSELLKRYSKILNNITGSLNSVINTIKDYNA